MLSIFSCVYWPFVHLRWRNVYSSPLPIKKKIFTYLFLAMLGLHCCTNFSLVAVSRGYSLVVVHGLLISVASLVVEACRIAACGLSGCSSLALERRLNSSGAQA